MIFPVSTESLKEAKPANGSKQTLRHQLTLVTIAGLFASAWATATAGAPLTEFARRLGCSNFQFGVLSALPFIASLACLPAAWWIERWGRRKPVFFFGLFSQRYLCFFIGLVPLWFWHRAGGGHSSLAVAVFLGLMLLMYATGSIGGVGWTSWMADMCPPRLFGRYFSRRRQLGIFAALPVAILSGYLMDRWHGGPGSMMLIVMIFITGAVFGIADIHTFHGVADITKPPRQTHILRQLAKSLKNKQFLWFAGFVAVLVFAVSFMGQFLTLYLQEEAKLSNTGIQLITLVAPMLAQLPVLTAWGRAADRMGKKPVLELAALGLVPVGLGWCFMTHGGFVLGFILSALGGMLWCGIDIVNFNLMLELSADQDGAGDSSYVAVNSIIISIAGCLGGLTAGCIGKWMQTWHWQPIPGLKIFTFYDVLFVLSAVLRLVAAVVFLPHIHEPEAQPTRQTLGFMTANIYNNLFSAVMQPLRAIGLVKPMPNENQ